MIFSSFFKVLIFIASLKKGQNIAYNASCATKENRAIQGDSMKHSLQEGQKARVLKGYYACNAVERDQLAMLEFSTRPSEAFVKRIAGIGGDTLEFEGEHAKLNGTYVEMDHLKARVMSSYKK